MPTFYLRIRADYDKTMPLKCGNLDCLAVLEPPFDSWKIGNREQLMCVGCVDDLTTLKGELEVHVE